MKLHLDELTIPTPPYRAPLATLAVANEKDSDPEGDTGYTEEIEKAEAYKNRSEQAEWEQALGVQESVPVSKVEKAKEDRIAEIDAAPVLEGASPDIIAEDTTKRKDTKRKITEIAAAQVAPRITSYKYTLNPKDIEEGKTTARWDSLNRVTTKEELLAEMRNLGAQQEAMAAAEAYLKGTGKLNAVPEDFGIRTAVQRVKQLSNDSENILKGLEPDRTPEQRALDGQRAEELRAKGKLRSKPDFDIEFEHPEEVAHTPIDATPSFDVEFEHPEKSEQERMQELEQLRNSAQEKAQKARAAGDTEGAKIAEQMFWKARNEFARLNAKQQARELNRKEDEETLNKDASMNVLGQARDGVTLEVPLQDESLDILREANGVQSSKPDESLDIMQEARGEDTIPRSPTEMPVETAPAATPSTDVGSERVILPPTPEIDRTRMEAQATENSPLTPEVPPSVESAPASSAPENLGDEVIGIEDIDRMGSDEAPSRWERLLATLSAEAPDRLAAWFAWGESVSERLLQKAKTRRENLEKKAQALADKPLIGFMSPFWYNGRIAMRRAWEETVTMNLRSLMRQREYSEGMRNNIINRFRLRFDVPIDTLRARQQYYQEKIDDADVILQVKGNKISILSESQSRMKGAALQVILKKIDTLTQEYRELLQRKEGLEDKRNGCERKADRLDTYRTKFVRIGKPADRPTAYEAPDMTKESKALKGTRRVGRPAKDKVAA